MVAFGMTEDGKPLHPGRILLIQAMEPLGISRNQLARDIDVPVGRISDITNGKRGITADTALRLGRYFGTGPELWLRLQAEYDLHVARITTWPAVESRVRTLDVREDAAPAPVAAEPVSASPDTEDDEVEPEPYVLPGDVQADEEAKVWSPSALPASDPDIAEVRPYSEAPATDEDLTAETVIPEGPASAIEAEDGADEDIGIPPAPGAGRAVSG